MICRIYRRRGLFQHICISQVIIIYPKVKNQLYKFHHLQIKKRYSTSDSKIELPNIETIKILFDQTPPFDVKRGASELSHLNKVKEFTIAKGGRKGFMVYIYECFAYAPNDKNKKILKILEGQLSGLALILHIKYRGSIPLLSIIKILFITYIPNSTISK